MSDCEMEVEQILDKRIMKGKPQYYVKWVGFNSANNSWEPASELNCSELIDAYESKENRRKEIKNRVKEERLKQDMKKENSPKTPKGKSKNQDRKPFEKPRGNTPNKGDEDSAADPKSKMESHDSDREGGDDVVITGFITINDVLHATVDDGSGKTDLMDIDQLKKKYMEQLLEAIELKLFPDGRN